MKGYIAFVKKEFLESVRTYKIFIMFSVFLIFGMINPLTAKLTPELIKEFVPKGVTITMQRPTAIDSWTQFFQNTSQIGLIILTFMFSSIVSLEVLKKTLINIITKGLKRSIVILSKFTVIFVIWTVSYILSFIVTYLYTVYLFPIDNIKNLGFALFCLWFFGVLLISIIIFSSTISKNVSGSLFSIGGIVLIMLILNMIYKFKKYNPLYLINNNIFILSNNISIASFKWSIGISAMLTVIFLLFSIIIFNKKQI